LQNFDVQFGKSLTVSEAASSTTPSAISQMPRPEAGTGNSMSKDIDAQKAMLLASYSSVLGGGKTVSPYSSTQSGEKVFQFTPSVDLQAALAALKRKNVANVPQASNVTNNPSTDPSAVGPGKLDKTAVEADKQQLTQAQLNQVVILGAMQSTLHALSETEKQSKKSIEKISLKNVVSQRRMAEKLLL